MARKLFIAATGQHCGKTTISLSLLHLAQKKYSRVGFIKPLGPKPARLNGIPADKDAALMAQILGQEEMIRLMSPLVLNPATPKRCCAGSWILPQCISKFVKPVPIWSANAIS